MGAEPAIRTVYSFNSGSVEVPFSGLVQAADANFYGTTPSNSLSRLVSKGTVFRLTPSGDFTTVWSFSGTDGSDPEGGLVLAHDGNLYGTTSAGGASGQGTIFRLSVSGSFETVHSFSATEGSSPRFDLCEGVDGGFYGVTWNPTGGPLPTVFRVSKDGVLTTLFTFTSTIGGPNDGLVQGPDGWLYGTTDRGVLISGTAAVTIYKVSTNGEFRLLKEFRTQSFTTPHPLAGVTFGPDGAMYGTIGNGWGNGEEGFFRFTTNGQFSTLFNFSQVSGYRPNSRLLLGNDGTFYGTTAFGAISNHGSIFRIATNGSFRLVASFTAETGETSGVEYVPPLTQGQDGNVYGTGRKLPNPSSMTFSSVIFRVVERPLISPAFSTGKMTLTWSAFPNAVYQILYKTSVDGTGWNAIQNVTAASNSASFTSDLVTAERGFYRVELLP